MITTTANRVKAAGYWCQDGDKESLRLIQSLSKATGEEVTLDTEIDMRDTLKHIGISSTLLALGVPRARYTQASIKILLQYCQLLLTWVEDEFSRQLDRDIRLPREQARFHGDRYAVQRKQLLEEWLKRKYGTEHPSILALCNTMVILLSEYPLNVKAVHATKALLSTPELEDKYEVLRAKLMEILNEHSV